MACCKGDPTGMIKIGGSSGPRYSKEQQELQKQLIGMVSPMLGKGATPYPGAVNAAVDPLQLMAANIFSTMGQGRGYTAPPFMNAQGMSGAGSSIPSTPVNFQSSGGQAQRKLRDFTPLPWTNPKDPGTWQDERARRGEGIGPGWNTDPGVPNRQSQWPTGYDPMNDPTGWKNWWY